MSRNSRVSPVLKWVGGKRQLLPSLLPLVPDTYTTYCEPFVGGGALLFSIQPKHAIINDVNKELINVYETVRDNVEGVLSALKECKNTPEFFYEIRSLDRDIEKYASLSNVERAARIIYLNKTCFNGLYRVNRKGEFNVPFGSYKNPQIIDEDTLRVVSEYFQENEIIFYNKDYSDVLEQLPFESFVYLDPPYDIFSKTSSFVGYAKGGFDRDKQVQLRDACVSLTKKGIKFMLSNSATDFIKELYSDFDIKIVKANRAVNSDGSKRGKVEEVIVRNYD